MKVFDAHCHLQDPRILSKVPQLIAKAQEVGVAAFAVNGVSENDWPLVNQLSQSYPSSIIPCFGLHPWFVQERTPNWFDTLKHMLDSTPSAAVGEIGLDKGSKGKQIDFTDQIQVFEQQLQLAKDLKRPASVHCVRAFGDLLAIMQRMGPFPTGVILHSYLGSAEMVPEFAKLGAYFSFSGFLMSVQQNKAKKMLKMVPSERILLETDAPDALPKSMSTSDSLFPVEGDSSSNSNAAETDASTLNHPENILIVLTYVASLLEMTKEEVAELSYQNAIRLFSYRDH
ncbi:TatD family [Parasponia andersonii]|uniref:TatD family n=1 Tax=Parasponia andersonii TaxID=3476 RepID=A0A2P5AKG7_PARAD|nr:TatD family [Parasponia andersonii]